MPRFLWSIGDVINNGVTLAKCCIMQKWEILCFSAKSQGKIQWEMNLTDPEQSLREIFVLINEGSVSPNLYNEKR